MVMRVALLGRTKLLFDCIDKVKAAGHEIVLIGTCTAAPEYEIKEVDFEKAAMREGAVFFNDSNINSTEIVNVMRNADADIAISVNWLTIIRQEAIESFRFGILNAHCGDLPRYRGNATPNWAVLNGENSYAISVHYMLPGELDAGNILIKKVYPMTERTTVTDIYENLSAEIPKLFCEALEKVENGGAVGSNQSKNVQDSLRCYPRIPTDSFIDFNMSRKHIIREVRASAHPFQGAFFYWNNLKIYVFEAEEEPFVSPSCVYPGQVIAVKKAGGEVWVAAKDGIIVLRRIYINNIEYDASEILKSTRIRLNYCLPEEIYQLKIQLAGLNDQVRKMQKIIEEHGFEI